MVLPNQHMLSIMTKKQSFETIYDRKKPALAVNVLELTVSSNPLKKSNIKA